MIKKNSYKKLYTVLFYLGVFNFCTCCIQIFIVCFVASFKLCCVCCWLAVCIVVVVLCVLLSYVYLFYVFFALDAGLLARSQYSEGPAPGHLDTGFSWFPCV